MSNLLEPKLVGRADLVTALNLVMERPDLNGAIVFGEIGMGKSALAQHLVERGSSGVRTFFIQGAVGLSEVPYGALAPMFDEIGNGTLDSALAVLRAVMTHLRRESAGRTSLVIVDDAHLLDDQTSHLLAQLTINGSIHFLGFSRPHGGYSDELASLVDDRVLARFDLTPLTRDDVAECCRHLLEGSITSAASDYFAEESGGNPLFLRSIVLHALRVQCLVVSEDVHVLLHEPDEVDPSLRDLVSSSVRDMPTDERDVLDCAALAGEVPFLRLSALAGDLAVRGLIERGFIRAAATDQTVAVCNPPLYAKILRSLVPSGRSAELYHRLLPPGTSLPPFGAGRIRRICWALDSNESVADDILLQAARVASSGFDPAAALRLASAVRSSGRSVAGAVEASRAQYMMRRALPNPASARALMNRAPDEESLAAAALLAAHLELAVSGRAEEILETADVWAGRLLVLLRDPGASEENHQSLKRVGLLRALALNFLGRFDESEPILAELFDLPGPPKQTAVCHALLGEALGATGRAEAGLRHVEAALEVIRADQESLGEVRDTIVFRHVALLIHNGEFGRAQDALTGYNDELHKDYFFSSGTLGVLQGVLHLRLGRFSLAHESLHHAIAALRVSDHDVMLPYALALFAWTAAVLEHDVLSDRIIAEFELQEQRGSMVFGLLGNASIAAARDRLRPTSDHLVELDRLAQQASSAGLVGCEKDILEMLILLGSDVHAARLADVTRGLEGTEASVLHQYANALVTEDAQLFVQVGDTAADMGKHFVAVDAAARALRLFGLRKDQKSQRNVLRVLRHRRGQLEHLVTSGGSEMNELKNLTARELKIASLAATGASNRDIAKALTVSPRTVEGHLYRIYVKLGITKRDELATVVEAQSNPRSSFV